MKFLLTDDDGNIVMVVTASTPAMAAQQLNGVRLHTGLATQIHAVERDAGVINDAHVFVKDGVITAKPGTYSERIPTRKDDPGAQVPHSEHPGAQHAGMIVHRFYPELIATNIEEAE